MTDTPRPAARLVELPSRGGRMAVLDFGPAGRPADIVFSHANGFNAFTYRSILAPLAADLRIQAIDLRGHGASELPAVVEGRHGWQEFAGDLIAFLRAEVGRPVVLAGHSMGATSSLLAAAEAPELVRSLVLFDPVLVPDIHVTPVNPGSPLVQGALRRRDSFADLETAVQSYLGRGAFRTWDEAQLRDYLAGGLKPGADGELTLACAPAWEASNFLTHNYDPLDAFRRSHAPIHILKAERGSTSRLEGYLAEIGTDPRVRVESIPGTTHFLPMERPDLVQAALREACA